LHAHFHICGHVLLRVSRARCRSLQCVSTARSLADDANSLVLQGKLNSVQCANAPAHDLLSPLLRRKKNFAKKARVSRQSTECGPVRHSMSAMKTATT
jgi:hypothetical protein